MKTAFVFPGQGSQYVGMGQDLAAEYPAARSVFEQADAILGFPLAQLCFTGPDTTLTDTVNAQPALLTHSVAAWRVLQFVSPGLAADFVAGHSMGEYTALVAAGVIDFAQALELVRERGRVMKRAGEETPGSMAAVIGMNDAALEGVCRETGAQIANYNSPGQIVISGSQAAIQQASALAKERGAKRVLPLAVSIASHSRLMESAAKEFEAAVAAVSLRPPTVPVISNVTAQPLTNADEIKREMIDQLTRSVQWTRSIEYLIAQGVANFVELGPKDVLAGLVRRIHKEARAISVGDVASVKAFLENKPTGA